MQSSPPAGQIVVLNGAPRSGKSSIAAVIQDNFDGVWTNLGVDVFVRFVTPERYRPGIGLRPGGERPDLEALVPTFYAALFESVAAHSRLGLNVVVDLGFHDAYTRPLGVLADSARRLRGLPVLFVGVRCPIEVIMRRRNAAKHGGESMYVAGTELDPVPAPVRRWQAAVHVPGVYDLEVDTSLLTPEDCAGRIHSRLVHGPPGTVFAKLANESPG